MPNMKKLIVSAQLIALDVVLTRLLAINTPVMKIGLGFASVALCAVLYGPWWAALAAALGDLVGAMITCISGSSYTALLKVRAVQLAVMLPVQIIVLSFLSRSSAVKKLLARAE